MCFDPDSSPPVPPVSGAAVDTAYVTLAADDGNDFLCFEATGPVAGPAVLVLPDVRGLYRFYEELAVRFAERGYDALAVDYFGRTAGVSTRDDDFDYVPHWQATTFDGVSGDAAAAVAHLRRNDPDRTVFVVGFCFGGSNAWHLAANGLGLAGVVGYYGHPDREMPAGAEHVLARVGDMECPVLALQGGDDPGIPVELADRFRDSLEAAGVDHEVVVYEGAPHSFFDRKAAEFAAEAEDSWNRVLAFFGANG